MDNEHWYLKHTLKNKLMLVFILSQFCLKASLPLHGSSSLNDLTSSLPHFWFCPTLAAPLLLLPFPYCNSWCKWGPFWGCLRGKYTAHWFSQIRWVLWNPLKWVSNTGTKLEYWIGNAIAQRKWGCLSVLLKNTGPVWSSVSPDQCWWAHILRKNLRHAPIIVQMSRLEQDKWASDSNWLLGQIQILNKPEKEIVVALFSNVVL